MSRLRDGEWIAGAGGVLLLVSLFLPWYGAGPFTASAWEALSRIDVVLALLALVPLALVALQATRRSPALPLAFSTLTLLAGALATVLVLYRIADRPGRDAIVSVEAGAWIGLLAAVAIAVGGWRSLRREDIPGAPVPPVEELPVPPA